MADYALTDKVIILTGAAGGIGQVMAREFASAGAHVVLVGRTEKSLNAVAETLGKSRSMVVPTDITDPDLVENLIATTVEAFGRLDAIVNNAGGGAMPREPEDTPYEDWVRLIDVNLTSTFSCCMAAGRQMIKQKFGKIINISSTAGTKGNPGLLHYSAAKAGMLSLTNNLAYSWAKHNICVNAVVPGLVATPAMIGWGAVPPAVTDDGEEVPRLTRPPAPADVANMCRFLLSPAADMITGETIPVRAWFAADRFWT
tara:strand:- start:389 stop:1159 length:771 start_codon:yes stop_codon:yes gene_type:complete